MIAKRRFLQRDQWQQPDDLSDPTTTRDDLLISRYVAALVTVARFAGSAAIVLGGVIAITGALMLIVVITGWDLGAHQRLLVRGPAAATAQAPNWMAPNAAF